MKKLLPLLLALPLLAVAETDYLALPVAQRNQQRLDSIDVRGPILTRPIWEDLRFPATGINPPGQASDPDIEPVWVGGPRTLAFGGAGTEVVICNVQMPHAWKVGTDLYPHIHVTQGSATATNDVVWRLDAWIAPINGAFSETADYSQTVTNTLDGVARKHEMISFPAIDMSGAANESSMLLVYLARLGGNTGDTSSADIYMLEFDIHYQVEKMGEEQNAFLPFYVPPTE